MLGKIISKFVNVSVYRYISQLESRIDELEMENVSINDSLCELESRLESKINKIRPVVYNIVNKDKNV
tara:strand:+ start:631 stop:834 length:204 start_codon:yes stop_codon:yes gene_type:complete